MKSRMLKTIVSAVMALTLAVMCMPLVSAIDYGGDCGEGLTWSYSEETGELKIEGTGSMDEYEYREVPWIDFVDDVKKITVCEGVEYISEEAFSCLENMEEISLPSTTNIVDGGFICNNNCKKITVADANPYNSSDENGALYDKNKTTLMLYPSGSDATEFTVPATVQKISENAFFCAYNLKYVTLPDGLLEIGKMAFYNTELLEKIEIPDSVIEIGFSAFEESGITSVKLPSSLVKIKECTFASCTKLSTVTIPDSVKVIEESAFWDCEELKTIIVPKSVTAIAVTAFEDCQAEINYVGSQADWEKITITDEHDVGMEMFKALKVNYDFKTEAQTTSAEKVQDDNTAKEDKSSENKMIIIVASVAVLLVVIIAAIALMIVSKGKNKNKEYKTK